MIRALLPWLLLAALGAGAAPRTPNTRAAPPARWSTHDLVVSPTTLSGFTTAAGTPSASQSVLINGTSLSGNVTVTAPAGFEVAWQPGGPYAATQTLTQTGGLVTNVPLHVRLIGTALGSYSGNVTIANAGSPTQSVAVSGTVTTAPTPNSSPLLNQVTPAVANGSTTVTLTFYGSNFVPGAVAIMSSATVISTTYVSSTELQALVRFPSVASTRQVTATVQNPTPGGGISNVVPFTIRAAAPVIISFSPASGPVGTVVTLQGTDLYLFTGNFSVTFNGTTGSLVGPPTPSDTQVAVRVPVGATTGLITLTNDNGAAVSATPFVVTATPPPFFEDFEQGTKTSYAPASVALQSGGWTFGEALIGTTTGTDKFNGTRSARLRGGGFVEMDVDKPNGAGVVTVSAATYATETGVSFVPEISTDGGVTYSSLLTGAAPVLTPNLTTYSFTANRPGNVRLRFSSTNTTAATNPRINLDDVGITNYVTTATPAGQALPTLQVYPNPAQHYLTVAAGRPGSVRTTLLDLTGRVVLPAAELPASQRLELPAQLAAGSYLLRVECQGEQRVLRVQKQ